MEHNNAECENLLRKLQELEFAAVELNLYLDNHPDNKNALADFNVISKELITVKKMYEQERGPLCNFGYSESQYPWCWVNDPWPWEIVE